MGSMMVVDRVADREDNHCPVPPDSPKQSGTGGHNLRSITNTSVAAAIKPRSVKKRAPTLSAQHDGGYVAGDQRSGARRIGGVPVEACKILIAFYLEGILKDERGQGFITYSALVAIFDLPSLNGNWLSHPLSEVLNHLDQEDTIANRPLRSCAVVNQGSRMPGNGFFQALAKTQGNLRIADANPRRAWRTEWNRARDFPYP